MVKVYVRAENQNIGLPKYMTEGASGADVCAFLKASVQLKPFERVLIPTGLYFEIPKGFEIQVRPRSGLAVKKGITVLNAPGTIDSDYRGELKVILINLSSETVTIDNGERIAQLVLSRTESMDLVPVQTLGNTDRGVGGFGHTGA